MVNVKILYLGSKSQWYRTDYGRYGLNNIVDMVSLIGVNRVTRIFKKKNTVLLLITLPKEYPENTMDRSQKEYVPYVPQDISVAPGWPAMAGYTYRHVIITRGT